MHSATSRLVVSLACCFAVFVVHVRAQAQTWIFVESIRPNDVIAKTEINVVVQVMGPVARVEASVGTRQIALTQNGAYPERFGGVLSLAGEVPGEKTLVVRAFDSNDVLTSVSVPFVLSGGLPQVTVQEPAWGTVMRTTSGLRVRATCVSTAPPCTFTAPVATAGAELDIPLEEVRLDSSTSDPWKTLNVSVLDSLGQRNHLSIRLFIETSDRLVEVLTASEGEVLAFDGTRALVRSANRTRIALWTSAGQSAVLYDGTDHITVAELHARGALLSAEESEYQRTPAPVWLWIDGALTRMEAAERARVNGRWLGYATRVEGSIRLVVRDLTSGQDVWTGPPNTWDFIGAFAVAANGDVIWHEGIGAHSWRHHEASIVLPNSYRGGDPRTDGVNAAYRGGGTSAIPTFLHNGEQAIEICRSTAVNACETPVLSGGWAAYRTIVPKPGPVSQYVPLRRSPSGGVEEFTGIADPEPIAINGAGESVLVSNQRYYLARTPSTPVEISASVGGRFVYADAWYRLVGRSVFRVLLPGDPTPPADGGLPSPSDAGVSDAASPYWAQGDANVVDAGTPGVGTATDAGGAAGGPGSDSGNAGGSSYDPIADAGAMQGDAGATPADAGAALDGGTDASLSHHRAVDGGSSTGDVEADDDDGCTLASAAPGRLDGTALLAALATLLATARRRRRARPEAA